MEFHIRHGWIHEILHDARSLTGARDGDAALVKATSEKIENTENLQRSKESRLNSKTKIFLDVFFP